MKFRSRTAVIVKKKKPTTKMPKMARGMTRRVGHRDGSSIGWGTAPSDSSATTSPNPWRCSLSQRMMFSNRKLQTLLLTVGAVSQEQDEEGICNWISDAAASMLGASLSAVALRFPEHDGVGVTYGKVEDSSLSIAAARDVSKLAAMEWPGPQKPGRVETLQTADLPTGRAYSEVDHLARVEVRTIQRHLGFLIVGRRTPWRLDPRELFVLTTLSNHTAVALENVRLHRTTVEQAETLRAVIEAPPLAIVVRDQDSNVRMWNTAAEHTFGWSQHEVLGRPYPLVPIDRQDEFRSNMERTLQGEMLAGLETRRQRKDGTIIDVAIWTAPLSDGGAVIIIADITEHKQAEEALQGLKVMEERSRLAREIHDTLAQSFTAIIWQLNAAATVDRGSGQASGALERVRNLAQEGLQEARRSVWDLRAGPLGGNTLPKALQQETEKVTGGRGIQTSVDVLGEETVLPPGVEAALLRICQESLANILKHAEATQVNVTLIYDDTKVQMTVEDNGIGFDPDMPGQPERRDGGFGLVSMGERARLIGGDLTVTSETGGGTTVNVILSRS